MPFTKINTDIKVLDFIQGQRNIGYGYDTSEGFKGLQYYSVNTPAKDSIFSIIPKNYHRHFSLALMVVNSDVAIHTDSGIFCCINFYLKPNNFKTSFYKVVNSSPTLKKIKNQTNGNIYNHEDVTEIGNFIAEPNDVYLLDVTKPHGLVRVTKDSNEDRIVLTLTTEALTYKEVLELGIVK
jgi:hypothetical protein